jgi:hypothetical protein
MSEPERGAASTTTTPRARPEMIRLRRGKWRAWGTVPSGGSAILTADNQLFTLQFRLVLSTRVRHNAVNLYG